MEHIETQKEQSDDREKDALDSVGQADRPIELVLAPDAAVEPVSASGIQGESEALQGNYEHQTQAPQGNQQIDEIGSGTIFAGKYEVCHRLGSGGMSTVYKARDLLMSRTVALKILNNDRRLSNESILRFQQEARAASQLNHKHIVRIHEFNTSEDSRPYLVMDFVEGHSLGNEIAQKGRLAWKDGLPWFLQIADALAEAHAHNVIHRDIKPDNIMLSQEKNSEVSARLVDFGIAKWQEEDDSNRPALTQTGQVFGTPSYMSPEQASGKTVDGRTDIYSFGCVMFEALTGSPPFAADNSLQVLHKHITDAAPSFKSVVPEGAFNGDLEKIVMRCLEKDPQNRFQTFMALKSDLEAVSRGGRAPEANKHQARKATTQLTRLWLQQLKLSAIVVGLIVIGLVMFRTWNELMEPSWMKLADKASTMASSGTGTAEYLNAQDLLKDALADATAHNAPTSQRAEILWRLGSLRARPEYRDFETALATFEEILALTGGADPKHGRVYAMICICEANLQHTRSAIAAGEKAIAVEVKEGSLSDRNASPQERITGLYSRMLLKLASAYKKTNQLPSAESVVKRYIEYQTSACPQSPELAGGYWLLAHILADQGRVGDAIAAGNIALQMSENTDGAGYPPDETRERKSWLTTYMKSHGDAVNIHHDQ